MRNPAVHPYSPALRAASTSAAAVAVSHTGSQPSPVLSWDAAKHA
ncbi:hypothetical protein SAMN05216298_0465 [Glycomyces sambucus]|uniref:Uncharacterized protein n=1 Tax=Glycomyces sambucus TaxID=380244 RepID=A0A1G9CQQ3_9ACTN|nr:hypothetical protein SAMN05216298_0465 [Glycomyces sambucus]